MAKIYWQLNKKTFISYAVISFLLYILMCLPIVINYLDLETIYNVSDGKEAILKVLLPVIVYALSLGAVGVATLIASFRIIAAPFRKGQLEQVLQIGENVKLYTLYHTFCVIISTLIPMVAMALASRMLGKFDMTLAGLTLYNTPREFLRMLLMTIASTGWCLAIPLCIYNDALLKNWARKKRIVFFFVTILLAWGTVSFAEDIPTMIENYNVGMEIVDEQLVVDEEDLTSKIESLNKNVKISYITDAVGVGLFVLTYYGFSKHYTIRK